MSAYLTFLCVNRSTPMLHAFRTFWGMMPGAPSTAKQRGLPGKLFSSSTLQSVCFVRCQIFLGHFSREHVIAPYLVSDHDRHESQSDTQHDLQGKRAGG